TTGRWCRSSCGNCRRCRAASAGGGIGIFPQKSARNPKRSLGLLNVDRFCEHKVGADAVGLGHAHLSFDQSDRQRALIGAGISCALEEQRSVLIILAVYDDGVVMLR